MRLSENALPQFLSGALLVALTAISGLVYGTMSGRWGAGRPMQAAAERLEQLPDDFGSWHVERHLTLGDEAVATLQCPAYIARRYVNVSTGASVDVGVFLGPTGPISVHVPEVCFPGRDFELYNAAKTVRVSDEGANDEVWFTDFRSTRLEGEIVRAYYGWSTGGSWIAAENPRWHFVGRPYLYKIQLVGLAPAPGVAASADECRAFLRDFLPLLKNYTIETPSR